tara:strand:- start:2594 stop:2809 length:216 start_codon:yes stop_codon:yes gene_type:complete
MDKKIKKEIKRWKKIPYAILIGFAIVSFWRGVWELSEIYIFPENHELSLWVSLILGMGILVFTHKLLKQLM